MGSIGIHLSPLEFIWVEYVKIWNTITIDQVYHWSPLESIGVGDFKFYWSCFPLESIGVEDSVWSLVESIEVDAVGGVRT